MKLSIIIPAYNEEKNIGATLRKLLQGLDKTLTYPYEIIVISDGSTDRTAQNARKIASLKVKVLEYSKNHGKGYALTFGVKNSKSEIVTFLDAGGDFPPDLIDKFIKLLEVFDADIVIGSKRHPASVINYPLKRRFYSRLYQLLIRLLFNLNIRDTQTGLKVFKRKVLGKILPRALVKQYAFDLELLVIARQLGYRKIFEAPVRMNYNFQTSNIGFQTIFNILRDTAAIFYRAKILRYYGQPHIKIAKQKIDNKAIE